MEHLNINEIREILNDNNLNYMIKINSRDTLLRSNGEVGKTCNLYVSSNFNLINFIDFLYASEHGDFRYVDDLKENNIAMIEGDLKDENISILRYFNNNLSDFDIIIMQDSVTDDYTKFFGFYLERD